MAGNGGVVLILGSAPNAIHARDWPKDHFDRIVTINNAWRIRSDWDHVVFPEDFPLSHRPLALGPGQRAVEAAEFVPAQNRYGGFLHAGATMAFTAAYWVLDVLRPRVMAFMGCDMVYPDKGQTHFYGKGAADPLREDISLRDLEAKSARLGLLAASGGCACVNLSPDPSRLVFPRRMPEELAAMPPVRADLRAIAVLRARETTLGYTTPGGWHDATGESYRMPALEALDAAWRGLYDATF